MFILIGLSSVAAAQTQKKTDSAANLCSERLEFRDSHQELIPVPPLPSVFVCVDAANKVIGVSFFSATSQGWAWLSVKDIQDVDTRAELVPGGILLPTGLTSFAYEYGGRNAGLAMLRDYEMKVLYRNARIKSMEAAGVVAAELLAR
ncbi:MAG: hypothetical protein HY925_04825 [Elusimicrobia bacterium]|nr:hypothetical protein [Elusimicrobiota bacterium]